MNLLRRITPRVLILQLAGNAILAAIASVWLEIPDSHTWQLLLSVVIAIALIAAFLWLHTITLRILRQPLTVITLWFSSILLAAWLLLTKAFTTAIAHLDDNSSQRAGYWNSKLSPHWRNIFTYERLDTWQTNLTQFVLWVILPAIVLPFLIETVTTGLRAPAWRNAARTLQRWQHWLTVLLVSIAGRSITNHLIDWHPTDTIHGELISAALRLPLAYVLAVLLALIVLTVTAVLLGRANTQRNAVP